MKRHHCFGMSNKWDFEGELEELHARHLLRETRLVAAAAGGEVEFAGSRLVNFGSNDYLGLSRHPRLAAVAAEAAARFGVGSGASRLITGTLPPHAELEEVLAQFKQAEAALAFSSGFATATGVVPALVGEGDVVIADKLIHACLVDGARLSGAILRVFPHNHLGRLESLLKWARANHPSARVLVLTESVFSMDGDVAPLEQIAGLKERFDALLLVDEAHAVGLLGPSGRGLASTPVLQGRVDIQMGTLSKAVGVSGGYVAGSRALIRLLVNRARSFIFSTAPPPMVAAAAVESIRLILSEEGETLRERLRGLLAEFDAILPGRFSMEGVCGPIRPIHLGSEADALEAAALARERGFLLPAVRYPTVPRGRARLRATITAAHTSGQIDAVGKFLGRLAERVGELEKERNAA